MSVTIKDVARETNLAAGTISKYLNGKTVRPQNRERIEKAIEKLNYRPSPLARGLRTARSYRIALLLSGLEGAHSAKLVAALDEAVQSMGCLLTIYCHRESPEIAREYVRLMVEQSVDGIVLIPAYTQEDYLEEARKAGIPVVVLEETCGIGDADVVQVDCAGAAYSLTEHLIVNGHRRIGVIRGLEESNTARERLRGFLRAMEDYELPVQEEYLAEGSYDYASGYQGIKRLWSLPLRPTAVFVTNYHMSIGALAAINQEGIRIPEELSLAAFDDMELSSLVQPGLTAVRQPIPELMQTACRLLERRIAGDLRDCPARVRLKARIIFRDSVQRI